MAPRSRITESLMPILTAKGLSKAFGAAPLFSDLDLAIARGERIGLVGANGTGKSTLAKILAGLEHSDSGELAIRRGAKVAYLDQDPRSEERRVGNESS